MAISSSSIAAGVGVAATNTQFAPSVSVLQRKVLIIGTYDPLKTAVVDEVPVQITSPEDAGDKFEFGYMIHRLAMGVFAGSGGVECWVSPQSEPGGAQAAGTLTVTGPSTAAGEIHLYIAGQKTPAIAVASGDTATVIGDAIVAAITADKTLPVTAVNAVGTVTVTAKTDGTYGNNINMSLNLGLKEELPAGVAIVVVQLTSGSGTPTIADALDGLGTGDGANENHFTDIVHGYLQDSTTLNALSTYNGIGNQWVGCYGKMVARPFRALTGDTDPGSSALTALIAVGNGRKSDRTNGIIPVPDSPNHPSEIAAIVSGMAAALNGNRAEGYLTGQVIPGVLPGTDVADRWTTEYDSRNSAVVAGIGSTHVEGGSVVIKDVVSFYHPDNVPVTSNGYADWGDISITQNILNSNKTNWSAERWQGISIVADKAAVGEVASRAKARDINDVHSDMIALATLFENNAWIYSAEFTIAKIQDKNNPLVTIRPGGLGFNIVLPVQYRGKGRIIDMSFEFDTDITTLA
jgi:phage tail sheath gpL-like